MASENGDDLIDEDLIYDDCDDECDVNEEEEQALLAGAEQGDVDLGLNTIEEIEHSNEGLHLALTQESEEYIEEYQETTGHELDNEDILQNIGDAHEIGNLAVAEEEEEEEEDEDNEAAARGRDRFKSERTKISLTDVKRNHNIPDSLDEVKTGRTFGNFNRFRGRGRGFYKSRGSNFQPKHQNVGVRIMGFNQQPLLRQPFPHPQQMLWDPPYESGLCDPNRIVQRPFGPHFGGPIGPGHFPPALHVPQGAPMPGPNFHMQRSPMMQRAMPPQAFNDWGCENALTQIQDPGYVNFNESPVVSSPYQGPPRQSSKRQIHDVSGPGAHKQMRFQGPPIKPAGPIEKQEIQKRPIFSRISRGGHIQSSNPNLTTIQTVDLQSTKTPTKAENSSTPDMPANRANRSCESKDDAKMNTDQKLFADPEEEEYKKKLEEQQRKRAEILAKKEMRRKEIATSKAQQNASKVPQKQEEETKAINDSNHVRGSPNKSKILLHRKGIPTKSSLQQTSKTPRPQMSRKFPLSNVQHPRMTRPPPTQILHNPAKNYSQPESFPQEKTFYRNIDTSLPPPPAINQHRDLSYIEPPVFEEPPPMANSFSRPQLPPPHSAPRFTSPPPIQRQVFPPNRPPIVRSRMGVPGIRLNPLNRLPNVPLNRPPPTVPRSHLGARLGGPPPNLSVRPPPHIPNHPPPTQVIREPPPPRVLREPPPSHSLSRPPPFSHPPPTRSIPPPQIHQAPLHSKAALRYNRPPPSLPPHSHPQEAPTPNLPHHPPSISVESDANQHIDVPYETYEAYPMEQSGEQFGEENYEYGQEFQEPYEYQYDGLNVEQDEYLESSQGYEESRKPYAREQNQFSTVKHIQLKSSQTRPKIASRLTPRQPQLKILSPTSPSQVALHSNYLDQAQVEMSHSIPIVSRNPSRALQTAVKKRFKRVTRRNRHGEIISIKKVPIDNQGNIIGPEETEFINEEIQEIEARRAKQQHSRPVTKTPPVTKMRQIVHSAPIKKLSQQPLTTEYASLDSQVQYQPMQHSIKQRLTSEQLVKSVLQRTRLKNPNPNLRNSRMHLQEGHQIEMKKPAVARLNSPTRRVVTAPNQSSSGLVSTPSSSNITIVPARYTVKISNLPPDISMEDLEDLAWMGGSGYFEEILYKDTLNECTVHFLNINNARKLCSKMNMATINGNALRARIVME